ncbi:unnamed protein product [Larinioides sclopetarius]|uniref:ATPase AAA-type core domain-containing protein n=1 Tax=Larinioides sclopetarius TaxID=280406 RepID=A0AAV1YQP4_9ARAC
MCSLSPEFQKIEEHRMCPATESVILLYGPPGNSKSTFMKVLSRQINSKLLCVTPTLLKSFDVGQDQVLQHFPSEILLFKERSSITIFAATNLPWAIDEALHRRFEIKIYIPLPNDEARYNLLKKCFDTISTSKKVNFLQLANDLDGCSTHDVILFCR